MSLLTRLTFPPEGEDKIPTHQFMALVAEYQRGVSGVDKTVIADTFDITDAGELLELDAILTEVISRRTSRELLHDALLLGESEIYNLNKVTNRIAQPNGDTDLEALAYRQIYRIQNFASRGNFAFKGCNVNAPSKDLTLEVVGGSILAGGRIVAAVADNPALAVPTPDAELPRVDLIYVDSSGTVLIRQGIPALEPKAPQVGNLEVAMAFVFVGANAVAITAKHVLDVRVVKDHGPLKIGRKSNPQTITDDSTYNVFWSQDIPPYLLTGATVRLVATGTFLANSAGNEPSIDFRFRYGSTQLWRGSTPTLTASADPQPWRVVLELSGQDDAVQVLGGEITIGEDSPNVGVGVVGTAKGTPIKGSAAEDSTTLLDLDISIKMSTASTENSVTLDWAYAELI